MAQKLTISGKRYYLLDEAEYKRASAPAALPPLPGRDDTGGVPAVAYVRALIARRINQARTARGWSQAELARRAGIRVETLNRIEKCHRSADPRSIDRIDAALRLRPRRQRGRAL
jgi:ribosome-binding protein aMBF1 (putative translation factor)